MIPPHNSAFSFRAMPQVSFEQGIKKFTDWVLQQEVQEDNLEKSLEEMKKKGLYK
jgi:dTDP-L-rhamnose 4-epimerase